MECTARGPASEGERTSQMMSKEEGQADDARRVIRHRMTFSAINVINEVR